MGRTLGLMDEWENRKMAKSRLYRCLRMSTFYTQLVTKLLCRNCTSSKGLICKKQISAGTFGKRFKGGFNRKILIYI